MQTDKLKIPCMFVRRIAAAILALSLLCGLSASASALELVPVGRAVGISLSSGGLLVSGLSDIDTETGLKNPAAAAGIRPGDLITAVDGNPVDSAESFIGAIASCGETLTLTVKRGEQVLQLQVLPVDVGEGVKKLGLWLRDGISGIGTVTYYDPCTGRYGALGHPVSDVDSGTIMPLAHGNIMCAEIVDVHRGECGTPGELCGCYDESCVIGSIEKNTPCGIFGTVSAANFDNSRAMPVASAGEVTLGSAEILTNVGGDEADRFDIEITQIYSGDRSGRSMMLEITDPELIEITGGIVQGMSGSPIIQDGKLVGAVTHVLVSDPTRGYGIFIENMLDAAG